MWCKAVLYFSGIWVVELMDKTEIEIEHVVGQPILETLCVGLDLTSMIPTFKTEAPCFIDFGVL